MLCVIVFDGNGKNHGIIAGNQTKMVYILNNFVSKSISGLIIQLSKWFISATSSHLIIFYFIWDLIECKTKIRLCLNVMNKSGISAEAASYYK